MGWRHLFCVGVTVLLASADVGADEGRIPLRVLYLARSDNGPREQAFTDFFRQEFASVSTRKRNDFVPQDAAGVDVVILDWSQQERGSNEVTSPISPLETWDKPIVFLGSAGLLMAGPWNVIGGAG